LEQFKERRTVTENEAQINVGNDESGKIAAAETREGTSDTSDFKSRSAGGKPDLTDAPRTAALEVVVDHSIDKAMKILKRKLIKEGLFKELKMRRYFEKPSERRKRKLKESLKKARKEASRLKKNPFL
jgi:small subunit ribosomal protein S21